MAFTIHRGTNISHWLSQSRLDHEQRETFFTADDVKRIADWGMDHLRLPIDETVMYAEPTVRDPRSFDFLDRALDWCDAAGLRAIVDLHIIRDHYFMQETPVLFTDPDAPDRFAAIWRDLSDHLRDRPVEKVAYELLNEPKAPDTATWNRVYRVAFDAVRQREPERTILIAPNWFNTAANADALEPPENDPHVIASFHFYEPMLLTHYQASWVPPLPEYTGPVHYPGPPIAEEDLPTVPPAVREWIDRGNHNRPFDPSVMRDLLQPPLRLRERTGLVLHCGEFGCRSITPLQPRRRWYRDLIDLFDEHDIAYSNWDYRGNFGLIDKDGTSNGVIDILTGKTSQA